MILAALCRLARRLAERPLHVFCSREKSEIVSIWRGILLQSQNALEGEWQEDSLSVMGQAQHSAMLVKTQYLVVC